MPRRVLDLNPVDVRHIGALHCKTRASQNRIRTALIDTSVLHSPADLEPQDWMNPSHVAATMLAVFQKSNRHPYFAEVERWFSAASLHDQIALLVDCLHQRSYLSNNCMAWILQSALAQERCRAGEPALAWPIPRLVSEAQKNGRTPLQQAAGGWQGVCYLPTMVALGEQVDALSANGSTALHLATNQTGDALSCERTEMLLALGADMNARDSKGRTPLDLAVDRPALAVVRTFMDAGAQPSAETWRKLREIKRWTEGWPVGTWQARQIAAVLPEPAAPPQGGRRL